MDQIKQRITMLLKQIEQQIKESNNVEERLKLITKYDSLLSKLLQLERLSKQKRGESRVKEIRISWASEHEE